MIIGFNEYSSTLEVQHPVSEPNEVVFVNTILDEALLSSRSEPNSSLTGKKKEWDTNTIMKMTFDNESTEAGSLNIKGLEIDTVKLKRRKIGSFDWITVAEKKFDGNSNNISEILSFIDRNTAPMAEYEYAVVPCSGEVEGTYNTDRVKTTIDGCYLYYNETRYKLYYNFKLGDIKHHIPNEVFEPISGTQYPIVAYAGDLNYRSGSIKCLILADDENPLSDLVAEANLRNSLMRFLTDKKPKAIKNADGLYMMIMITEAPVLEPIPEKTGLYNVTFDFVEVGDMEDAQDLLMNGFITRG